MKNKGYNQNSSIIFYAFRYVLGRKTYAVNEFVEHLILNIDVIQETDARIMEKEIHSAIDANIAGQDIDVEEWKRALEALSGVKKIAAIENTCSS